MSCPCDVHPCRTPVAIAAGLAVLPRAPSLFPDWRERLLAAVGRESALDGWRARESGDLGLMLVEMGAYVLDVCSFYDQLVANQSYLRTASLAGTQRRHVELLGYLPRPAVGSQAWLAAEADGTRVVALPASMAVRSSEFNGPAGPEPPQVFELEAPAAAEPRVNRFEVQRVAATALPSPLAGLDAKAGSVRVRAGDLVVLDDGTALGVTRVAAVTRPLLRIREPVSHIGFDTALVPAAGATYSGSRLLKPGARCGVWKLAPVGSEPAVITTHTLSLDTRLNLRAGDVVALDNGSTQEAHRISAVAEVKYTLIPALASDLQDAGGTVTGHVVSPPIQVAVTQLSFTGTLGFAAADAALLSVHHTMVDAAALHAPLKDTLAQGDPIAMPAFADAPRVPVTQWLLQDMHGDAVATTGTLDATTRSASGDASPAWGRELWAPVQFYGNVLEVTRGETVKDEALGVGDASLPFQTFRLKKKPLTYLSAATASGRKTTLTVHVGGVRWQEVDTFYGVAADAMAYTVRHDDEGHTDIHFGGGARLPSGAAVVANYRFGAGAAVPPADAIRQVARPVAGLRRLRNPLAAYGGADAEAPAELALRGPQSALLLGRAISLLDFETAAAAQPGVRAARAAWRWDAQGLAPVVDVAVIGDAQLAPGILAALRALAEADAPIAVRTATAQPAAMAVDIDIDPLQVPEDVIAAVQQALFAPVVLPGSGGLLRPERLGPDGVLFQSSVVAAVMAVAGVAALRTLVFDGTPFVDVGRRPAAGAYFDFESGGVSVNGVSGVNAP